MRQAKKVKETFMEFYYNDANGWRDDGHGLDVVECRHSSNSSSSYSDH